jgi:hypothetical protein
MALKYLDPKDPEASPLVVLAQQRHGNALSAVLDKHSAGQLAELAAWAKATVAPTASAASARPATIAPAQSALSQPATGEARPRAGTTADQVNVMRPPLDGSTDAPPKATPAAAPPFRDRYDPEIFNRRYHGR